MLGSNSSVVIVDIHDVRVKKSESDNGQSLAAAVVFTSVAVIECDLVIALCYQRIELRSSRIRLCCTEFRILHIADEELCVCEFTPLLDVSDSAISHALSQLTEAGLLTRRKDGKWRKYRATAHASAVLIALDGHAV